MAALVSSAVSFVLSSAVSPRAAVASSSAASLAAEHAYERRHFLSRGLMGADYPALEVESSAGVWVVEVYSDGFVANGDYLPVEALLAILQWYDGSLVDKFAVELSVSEESSLVDIEYPCCHMLAIGLLRFEHEVEALAFFYVRKLSFELIDGYSHAADKLKRSVWLGLLKEFRLAVCHVIELVFCSYELVG